MPRKKRRCLNKKEKSRMNWRREGNESVLVLFSLLCKENEHD
jgi:hypothetical protein